MFEKNMRIAYLLDFYGDILDDHAKSIMRAYYEDDLSLSEIADGEDISRQGVRHIIKKCEEQLEFLENKLGLASYFSQTQEAAESLGEVKEILSHSDNQQHREMADKIGRAIEKILNKSN